VTTWACVEEHIVKPSSWFTDLSGMFANLLKATNYLSHVCLSVEQFWCSYPLKGPSDVFLFLGWLHEFANPRSTKEEKRGVTVNRIWLNNNNNNKFFKLQIRPPNLILLITTSQDRWIFPSQSWEVRNSIIIIIVIIIWYHRLANCIISFDALGILTQIIHTLSCI